MVDEISSGGIVINNGKLILVFQNKSQTWNFPKGHVKENETLLETAKREIFEESGVKNLTFIKKLGSYTRGTKNNPTLQKKITIFQFTTTQTNLQPLDPENPEAKWVLIEKAVDLLDYKKDKNFFLKIKHLL